MARDVTASLDVRMTTEPLAQRANDREGPILELRNMSFAFGGTERTTAALANLNVRASRGEFLAMVGPSGCGKSTCLHVIAGLLEPSSGLLWFEDGKRPKVGYVFQHDALLPWRTALSNIELALELNGVSGAGAQRKARDLMASLGLAGFEQYFPRQLSGGMRKRVALACALVYEPALLLMDEPYSALDAQTRLLLQDDLLRLWERYRQTIIFVTHDLEEAVSLADRVVVLSARPGTVKSEFVVQLGRPRTVMGARSNPSFYDYVKRIWDDLKDEVSLT